MLKNTYTNTIHLKKEINLMISKNGLIIRMENFL